MIDLWGLAVSFSAAALFAVVAVPFAMRLAVRCGAVDRPDGYRKNQATPIPRSGGLAVALAGALAVMFALWLYSALDHPSVGWLLGALAPAAAILLAVGIVDDFASITGIYKLMGQVLAVSILVAAGGHFDKISVLGFVVPLGDFQIPFTIFFCLGAVNALI